MTDKINSFWEPESPLYCSAEWHLARLKSGWAGIIYSHALRISRESENYFCSIPQMAKYFNKDKRTIGSAFKELEDLGFFERLRHELGKAVNYKPITHTEWAKRHPDQCIEKSTMPWDKESDPLGRSLYAVCGGQVKLFFPNVLKGFRKVGFNDDEIVKEFKLFVNSNQEIEAHKITGWHGLIKRFGEYLRMKRACNQTAIKPVPPSSSLDSTVLAQSPPPSVVGRAGTSDVGGSGYIR